MTIRIRKVFVGSDESELECYVNADGKLFIGINMNEPLYTTGESIALDKDDVDQLIKNLKKYRKEMDEFEE